LESALVAVLQAYPTPAEVLPEKDLDLERGIFMRLVRWLIKYFHIPPDLVVERVRRSLKAS
jgi:hypothetical protein